MIDADRFRNVERAAYEHIGAAGYDVMPFGLGDWTPRYPRLAAKIATTYGPLRNAPDALVDTSAGPMWLEVVNGQTSEQGDRAVTLAKLAALWPWSLIAPCVVLDMADGGVWPFDVSWPYDVTGAGGPRGDRKAYAWLTRNHDMRFSDVWGAR